MRHDLTDITLILDRASSLGCIRDGVIYGLNTFLEAQRDARCGEAMFTLVQFAHAYDDDPAYQGKPIGEVPLVTTATFGPRGMAALLMAIERAILRTGRRLAAMREADRPGTVVLIIMAEGQAPDGRESYDLQHIRALITEQRERYGWTFLCLAAGQDAISLAHTLGIQEAKALQVAPTIEGTTAAYASVSNMLLCSRSGGGLIGFSDADRHQQLES